MLGELQKQESEGEETLWLAGRERHPSASEGMAVLDRRVPGSDTAAPILEVVAGCAASSHPGLSST